MNPKELTNEELATIIYALKITGLAPTQFEKDCLEEAHDRIIVLDNLQKKLNEIIERMEKECY